MNGAGTGEFTAFVNFSQELSKSKALISHCLMDLHVEPRSAPRIVNTNRTSPTVMVVLWISLSYSEARGFISHYTVAYSPLTSGIKRQSSAVLTVTVPGMDSNNVTIEDLDPDTQYEVIVSATNGADTGDPSATSVVSSFIGTNDTNILTLYANVGYAC